MFYDLSIYCVTIFQYLVKYILIISATHFYSLSMFWVCSSCPEMTEDSSYSFFAFNFLRLFIFYWNVRRFLILLSASTTSFFSIFSAPSSCHFHERVVTLLKLLQLRSWSYEFDIEKPSYLYQLLQLLSSQFFLLVLLGLCWLNYVTLLKLLQLRSCWDDHL